MALNRIGRVTGHVGEAKGRFAKDAKERQAAEDAPQSKILSKQDVQGDWDANRVLMTTLGGSLRPLTGSDLAAFRQNMRMTQARFKGGKGITARQVIDMASANPLNYLTHQPKGAKSDLDKARSEITTGVLVSATNGMLRFVTNAGRDSARTRHHVVITLNAYPEAAAQLSAARLDDRAAPRRIANWLRKQKLAFDCDCERHRYFLRYVATIGGFAAGRQEHGYPKIRNPNLHGVACKHVLRAMSELISSGTVLRTLEKHMTRLQASATDRARTQVAEKDAQRSAGKRGTAIKTGDEIRAQQRAARERRAAKSAAVRPFTGTKLSPSARKVQAALESGAINASDLAVLRKLKAMDLTPAGIAKLLSSIKG